MDWALVREQLDYGFQGAVATIKARYPDIHATPSWGTPRDLKFRGYVTFIYDARQRYEDLIFDFYVQPLMRTWPRRLDDSPLCPDAPDHPDSGQPDAAVFAIERGEGAVEVPELEPIVLPESEDSPHYERAVLEYAASAIALLEEHMELILDALSVQYLNPVEDRRLIEEYRKEGRTLPLGWFGERPSDR